MKDIKTWIKEFLALIGIILMGPVFVLILVLILEIPF
tara:strand:- start:101 stop:211 length:111 start_codon:yes stop_codon:yes gene_type:complete